MGIMRSSINKSLVLLFMIIYISPLQFSQSTDTLLPNQTMRDGQSLISTNNTFELGFFSPGSSSNRYVGIWYHKIPLQTIVWVANRDHPILDRSGFLMTGEEGNLVILDSTGGSIDVGSNTGKANLTSATLLDTGNLVLREMNGIGDDQALWQSFDNPTDTFLPGMKLGLNGRVNRLITSWKSSDDPGLGDYSIGIDPNGTHQFFMWQRAQIYWRSGDWNGQNFSLVPEMTPFYFENFSYTPNWSGGYYSYSFKDKSIVSRGVMDLLGQFKQLVWFRDVNDWILFHSQPNIFPCEVLYYCGANGVCSNSTSPTCKCLFGFQPNSMTQWESNNWSGGCVRRAKLQCGTFDGFLKLANVKLPVFFWRARDSSLDLEDCRAKCAKNCSCNAYASENANGSGCLFWSRDLIGLQENISGVQDLYVRLLASELDPIPDHEGKMVHWVIIISLAVSVVLLLLVISICYFMWKKSKGNLETNQELQLLKMSCSQEWSDRFLDTIKNGKCQKSPGCPFIDFLTIATATNKFSASNKLGEGGFGPVYMGTLEGHMIAVKRLSKDSGQGIAEFTNEITLIGNLQHTNLVRLLGYCIHKEEKILIYEYMPNKSLDLYIFDRIKGAELDWKKRFNIIEGIAQGILYLHKYSRLRIIHRDLKTSNILLDTEMNPKISDFGLARIFGQNENQANTRTVIGTYGYMSPEYALNGLFSTKSDVFSFGVIVLEVISGQKTTAFEILGKPENLLRYAWELGREGRSLELVDPSLGNFELSDEVSRCIHVALLCVQDSAANRPAMSDVVPMLCNETLSLPIPTQPSFSCMRALQYSSCDQVGSTVNDVTLTSIEGR